MSFLGIFVALIGFMYAIIVFVQRLSSDDYIYGWTPIVILILVLSGLQMLMLGTIGEYVWRTLSQSRDRPKYVVSKIIDKVE
jgi:dolichol-phosphate mannosyltransferase